MVGSGGIGLLREAGGGEGGWVDKEAGREMRLGTGTREKKKRKG